MLTKHTATAEELFTSKFQELTGESEWTIIGFAATLSDPWSYIDSVVDELQNELEEIHKPSWVDFLKRVDVFKEEVDASLQVKHYSSDLADKWYTEPEVSIKYDRNDYKNTPTYFTTQDSRSSREEWRRATEDSHRLRILVDYGNFDIAKTEAAGKAWLRVRTNVRKGVPFLSIGSVQINMQNGEAYCGVSGCKHRGRLTHKSGDKEWLEFQVMRILMHLGNHAIHDRQKVFPIFQAEVKMFRDAPKQKLITHKQYCNSERCKHSEQ